MGESCPEEWRQWVSNRRYMPLAAPPTVETRTTEEQLPQNDLEKAIVARIYEYFSGNATAFEACAAALVQLRSRDT